MPVPLDLMQRACVMYQECEIKCQTQESEEHQCREENKDASHTSPDVMLNMWRNRFR